MSSKQAEQIGDPWLSQLILRQSMLRSPQKPEVSIRWRLGVAALGETGVQGTPQFPEVHPSGTSSEATVA